MGGGRRVVYGIGAAKVCLPAFILHQPALGGTAHTFSDRSSPKIGFIATVLSCERHLGSQGGPKVTAVAMLSFSAKFILSQPSFSTGPKFRMNGRELDSRKKWVNRDAKHHAGIGARLRSKSWSGRCLPTVTSPRHRRGESAA